MSASTDITASTSNTPTRAFVPSQSVLLFVRMLQPTVWIALLDTYPAPVTARPTRETGQSATCVADVPGKSVRSGELCIAPRMVPHLAIGLLGIAVVLGSGMQEFAVVLFSGFTDLPLFTIGDWWRRGCRSDWERGGR